MNVGRVFPPVRCCDCLQLPKVDASFFRPSNFSQTGVGVAKLRLADCFGDIALLALRIGFVDCCEENIFWQGISIGFIADDLVEDVRECQILDSTPTSLPSKGPQI